MSNSAITIEFDGLLLVGREGELVLDDPERTDGGELPALGAEESVKIETLDVIELQFQGLPGF